MTDYSRGYRAALKAAAGLVDRWHIRNGGYTELAAVILALPVPGEAPAPAKEHSAECAMRLKLACICNVENGAPVPGEAPAAPPAEAPDVEEMRAAVPRLRKLIRDIDAQTSAQPEGQAAPDEQLGLYRKYEVRRLHDPAGKHADCDYFVLDWKHDKHMPAAIAAYAASCEAEYPGLARDLRARLGVAHAAAPGGEDATEALLRECAEALLAVRDSKYLAKAWRSVPVIRALVDRAVARLAARAGGSR